MKSKLFPLVLVVTISIQIVILIISTTFVTFIVILGIIIILNNVTYTHSVMRNATKAYLWSSESFQLFWCYNDRSHTHYELHHTLCMVKYLYEWYYSVHVYGG